jgi:hypothetical protein
MIVQSHVLHFKSLNSNLNRDFVRLLNHQKIRWTVSIVTIVKNQNTFLAIVVNLKRWTLIILYAKWTYTTKKIIRKILNRNRKKNNFLSRNVIIHNIENCESRVLMIKRTQKSWLLLRNYIQKIDFTIRHVFRWFARFNSTMNHFNWINLMISFLIKKLDCYRQHAISSSINDLTILLISQQNLLWSRISIIKWWNNKFT